MNPSIWEEWPDLLQYVIVPYRFSASALDRPFRCPISSFGKADELPGAIGPGIQALIGTAIHSLLQWRTLPYLKSLSERIEALEDCMRPILERLPATQYREVLPLTGQYREMAARSLAAAVGMNVVTKNHPTRTQRDYPLHTLSPKSLLYQAIQMPKEIEPAVLFEKPLMSNRWRLEGRADLIRVKTDIVEIIDFKSGRIVGEGGEILNGIKLQMNAYALMAAERWPSLQIRMRVIGVVDMYVPNDPKSQRRIEELLIELDKEFPSGKQLSSAATAKTGPGCRYCRLRPMCLSYLQSAAGEWARAMPRRERISTNDVWGRYLRRDDRFGAILIEIPEGRMAKVFGLRPEEIDELMPGNFVGIFGCETEGQPAASRAIHHPSNWWIRRQGRELAGVRLFVQPA